MLKNLLNKFRSHNEIDPMKYLIVGLGNIGPKYENTRHNIGFDILDALAEASNVVFESKRYGDVATLKFKGRTLILLKPSTFVNLSGKAVRYWMQQENIDVKNVLIVLDDIALPFGTLRIRSKGGDAGHNGLKNIQEILGHTNYARLRFGIGDDYSRGQQIDFVLGKWSEEETKIVDEKKKVASEAIKSFTTIGVERTMNLFNKK
ncbi:aminoacyl-tRNA hydrolase [Saccharicrinis sp. FJH54]|uniref:aminoacyl-tRNA hydrolase n=1 Tax=Saccharicrinis sp. FJH54 TaxID=3344665 RepID=UPI0035D50469